VAAVSVAGVVAVAGASGDTTPGVVHACKQKNNGQVRIVSDPSECRPSEEYQALASGAGPAPSLDAYARVEDGTLDATRSKNVVSMTRTTYTDPDADPEDPRLNVYCFDLTFVPANALGTEELELTEGEDPLTFGGIPLRAAVAGTDVLAELGCPATTDAAIAYGSAGVPDDIPPTHEDSFYVRFTT
jgi:hypothetical protein